MKPTKIKEMTLLRAAVTTPALRAKAAEASAETEPDPSGQEVMEVRFAPFSTWYEIDSWFEGRFMETVSPGSFKKTITERAGQIKVLFDHGFDPMIGYKALGPIDSLTEEKDSPLGVVPLLDTSYNRDLIPGLRAGLYGSSFRFEVIQDRWNDEPEPSDTNPRGLPERTITEVRLHEFGPVTFPANPAATAGLRSMTDRFMDHLRSRAPERYAELARQVASVRGTPLDYGAGYAPLPRPDEAARYAGGPREDAPGGIVTFAERRAALLKITKERSS